MVKRGRNASWACANLQRGSDSRTREMSGVGPIWQFIDSSSVGGAERHVATLADSLRRRAITAAVLLLEDHGDNPWLAQLEAADIPYRHLDGRFGTLVAALKAERPALLHTHGYKAGILGRAAARIARVPVVSTFHSGERGPYPVGAYECLDDWTSFLGARIAVSPRIRDRLPFSSTVIPSYVRTDAEAPVAPLPRLAGFVGRLSAEKGPDLFCRLAAAARTEPALCDAEWHVWGDGPMRRALEAEYAGVVTFHGVATDMDLVWPRIGLLVMPSRFEGVPLAALEAAAHGVPVLASAVGGLPSVVDVARTGWLFGVGDIAGALRGARQWTADIEQDAARLRRDCWLKARKDFSEDRWLPDVLAVYRQAGCPAA